MNLPVNKTFKNFVGGAYTRPESGKTLDFCGVRVPASSRKDLREAVEAAKKAAPPASAYNRGQIVYRLSEMMSARSGELVELLHREGMGKKTAIGEVTRATDRVLYMAGWADKYSQVLSSVNPVEGPYYVSTSPAPQGVCVLAAPGGPGLTLPLTRLMASFITGNRSVMLTEAGCLSRLTMGELIQASDFPPGTVNILSGELQELLPVAASHKQVALLDLPAYQGDIASLRQAATSNLKRIITPTAEQLHASSDTSASPGVIADFIEAQTVWHPLGF